MSWADGWPQPEPVQLAPRDEVVEETFDFADQTALAAPGWLGVRAAPESVASFTGRVIGLYASQGTVSFAGFRYRGGSSS